MRPSLQSIFVHFPQRHPKLLALIFTVSGCGAIVLGTLLLSGNPVRDASAEPLLLPEITCDDFSSWDAASEYFIDTEPELNASHALDSNHNGVPCEGLMSPDRPTDENFEVICGDFQHREEAEYFVDAYETSHENRFGLDRDLDGHPCESLPPIDSTSRAINRLNRLWRQDAGFGGDLNCNDFETWAEANSLFIQAGGPISDPHRLDGNNDGVPCEALPGAPG